MSGTFDFIDVNGLAGGLALGVARAGGRLKARTGDLDLGRNIVLANAHLFNNRWLYEDEITPGELDWREWPVYKAPVVTAVPPCSGFSTLTGKGAAGKAGTEQAHAGHKANDCMWRTVRYASRTDAEVVTFESVTGAWKQGRELMQQLRDELVQLTGEPWTLTHVLHDGLSHGAPASRKRYLFVATRGAARPFGVVRTKPLEYPRTVGEFIRDLESLEEKKGLQPYTAATLGSTDWGVDRARSESGQVDGHWSRVGSGWHKRIPSVLQVAEEFGVEWAPKTDMGVTMAKIAQACGDDLSEAGPLVRAMQSDEVARRMAGREYEFGVFKINRWAYDQTGYVVTGGGPMYTVHPTQARSLTYRELARVMGYPDDFRIDDELMGKEKLDAIWGKNVSVLVGEWLGRSVQLFLDGEAADLLTYGEKIGDDEYLIDEMDDARRLLRLQQQRLRRQRAAVTAGLTG